jgi:hypothetical protein
VSATKGWDERDYKLWSDIQALPSYGLIAPADEAFGHRNDRMISLKQVVELLEKHAQRRFDGPTPANSPRH